MRHDLIYRRDPDGQPVVGVALENAAGRAWVYRTDYQAVIAKMGAKRWFLNSDGRGLQYVCLSPAGTSRVVAIARIIMGADQGQRVRYRDRNRRNLRVGNLHPVRVASSSSSG